MAITKEVLDELLKDYRGSDDLTGEEGLLKQLTKALVKRAMGAELTEHLGYEKHEVGEKPSGNRRNGTSAKTVRSDQGSITLEVPRDRDGTFEPKIVGKHQRATRAAIEEAPRSTPAPCYTDLSSDSLLLLLQTCSC